MKKVLLLLLALNLIGATAYAKPEQRHDSALTRDDHIGHHADHSETPGQRERDRQAAERIGREVREHGCAGACAVGAGAMAGSAGVSGPVMGGIIAGAAFGCERMCPHNN